jgi:uncharacterized membrane protein YgcG
MTRSALVATCALLALLTGGLACAEERILDYDIEVQIQQDGALEVTEHIKVRAEHSQINRGIYRDFPTRYRDRFGNRVVVDLEVLSVLRNGQTEPWFTENQSNGVRINTGNDDYLPAPAEHTFTLRYRTTRQLGFFAAHDELYWNAIGTGWAFPIDGGQVDVRLPAAVEARLMSAEGYTGYQGAKGSDYDVTLLEGGHARWQLKRPLQPSEGFTIVLTFPKGIVAAPAAAQRAAWVLRDNLSILVGLIGLIVLIAYCVREWRRVGRDPPKGVIIARYEPPAGHTAASLRYVQEWGYDTGCFSAEVLSLAVAGCVRIVRDKGLPKDQWSLERTAVQLPADLPRAQRALIDRLFKGGKTTLVLEEANGSIVRSAQTAHRAAIRKSMPRRPYFDDNLRLLPKAIFITAGTVLVAGVIGGVAGALATIAITVVMIVVLVIFGWLIGAPTVAGRALMDEIEGLKLYLGVAERDELARMQGPGAPPPLDAERYEALLPYAVALEVEEAWTKKFTAAVGVAAAEEVTQNINWYHGEGISNLGSLSHAIGSGLTSQISSSSSPPGSSSGSDGGGSSGGGGGGGGGGGR